MFTARNAGSGTGSRSTRRKWRNGRRDGLKNRWGDPCGFESRFPHHPKFPDLTRFLRPRPLPFRHFRRVECPLALLHCCYRSAHLVRIQLEFRFPPSPAVFVRLRSRSSRPSLPRSLMRAFDTCIDSVVGQRRSARTRRRWHGACMLIETTVFQRDLKDPWDIPDDAVAVHQGGRAGRQLMATSRPFLAHKRGKSEHRPTGLFLLGQPPVPLPPARFFAWDAWVRWWPGACQDPR